MKFVYHLTHICLVFYLWNITNTTGMEQHGKTTFADLPENLQMTILLKSKPNLHQWLIEKYLNNHQKMPGYNPFGQVRIQGKNCFDDSIYARPILRDKLTGNQLQQNLQGHTNCISCFEVTPNGKKGITGSWDNSAIIWDMETGNQLKRLVGHTNSITCLSITPDGDKCITGSWDNSAIIWNIATGCELRRLKGHTAYIECLAITPNGQKVITGSSDKTAIVWDVAAGKQLCILSADHLQGHTSYIKCLAITPDGHQVITGSWDNLAIIWDIVTGQQLRVLHSHTGVINCLAITPGGKKVITGSSDKTAIIWDIVTGEQLRKLEGHLQAVCHLKIINDGKKVIIVPWNSTAVVWNLEHDELDAHLENLEIKGLRIVELAYMAAHKRKKLQLPQSIQSDYQQLPKLIKNLIEEHVEI